VKVNRRENDSDGYSWKNISALSIMFWHVHSHRCCQLTCSSATESLSHWASSFVYHIFNWNQTLPSSLPFVVWRTFNSTVNFIVDTSANRRLQMPKASFTAHELKLTKVFKHVYSSSTVHTGICGSRLAVLTPKLEFQAHAYRVREHQSIRA